MSKTPSPYPAKELLKRGPQLTYRGRNLDQIAFPLGGIGTGTISLGGWGQLRDWEILNRPAKGARGSSAGKKRATLTSDGFGEQPLA